MDNTSFTRALERSRRAEPERRLPILRQIIKKFDPLSEIEACNHDIDVRLASFEGTLPADSIVAVHISLAKAADLNGDVNILQNALISLLAIRSCMSFETVVLPTQTGAHDLISHGRRDLKNQPQLPVEIWGEISQWLPRSDLKTLLHIPHPLRGLASELYFREIILLFEMHPPLSMALNFELAQSAAWHMQRSLEILTRILRDVSFARRVRTLKISENESTHANLDFEIVLISKALTKLTSLRSFECEGWSKHLPAVIVAIPEALPQLASVTVRCSGYRGPFPKFSAPLKCLQELALFLPEMDASIYTDLLRELEPSLRRLRVHYNSGITGILPAIAPVLRNLTHLELSTSGMGPGNINVTVEAILCHGFRLEALHLYVHGAVQLPSAHFRTYANALPHLRSFGFHLKYHYGTLHDTDFFPAISDFLRDRSHIESLELVNEGSNQIGLNLDSWNILSSFPRLRRLSMIIPNDFSIRQACRVIPKTVRSLELSGPGAYSWFRGDQQSASKIDWPEQLRFISVPFNGGINYDALARTIVMVIPSIRVVKINRSYFAVACRTGTRVWVSMKWSSHKTRQPWLNEQLEACGCDAQPLFSVKADI